MAQLALFEVELVYVGILLTCAIFARWFLSRVEAAIRRKLLGALAGIGIVGFGYLFAKYPWSGRIKGISLPFGLDSLPLAYVGSACVLIFA
ncbi:MAG: hypothetical protein RMJ84_12200 [Sandaracinaceae bacterium]|nr:hypothetical protein [Sandaracinaceae bacterium]